VIVVGGHRLADSSFLFSSLPWEAGLYANVKIDAGSTFSAAGRLTIVGNGNRFYLGVHANLNLRVTQAFATLTFTNCTDSSCRYAAATTTLDAQTVVGFGGLAVSIKFRIAGDGSFSLRASIRTNPTKVCGFVSVWGAWFGGCT
jgi:hypothetical protein